MGRADELKGRILELVAEFHRARGEERVLFEEGRTRVPFAGRVHDEKEMVNLVESALEFWLTSGRFTERLEEGLARFLGSGNCLFVNSGSSANLLAFMALASEDMGDRRIARGDEVITVAACFPTTVTPILQYGAVPVFVDVTFPTYNVDCDQLEAALGPRTRAVVLAHTLGNPFDLDRVTAFCRKHGLWLIEDNCDALGSRYKGKYTGVFGDAATGSFYPAHHMTTGEGGAVFTRDSRLHAIALSLRDWGRDCICPPGRDNTCRQRFSRQFGRLPDGYDHKYVYSRFGYNLKATDMQAAIGVAQLEKLPRFIESRKRNFATLRKGLSDLEEWFVLPEATAGADPSWFGFPLSVRGPSGPDRRTVVSRLEAAGIQTRMLFAGNILRHPCFDGLQRVGGGFRTIGDLPNTDRIMRDTFWVGVYPGLTDRHLQYILDVLHSVAR